MSVVLTLTFTSHIMSRLRQFPLYNKPEPPAVLADHFKPDVFAKSQLYGKDKAKFSLLSGLYRQVLDFVLIQYGVYAVSWALAGRAISALGYGPEYEVCTARFVDFVPH